jgi:hypothetical protein
MSELDNCKICRKQNKFIIPSLFKPRRCVKPCDKDICEMCRICSLEHASLSQFDEMKENIRIQQHEDIDNLCARQRTEFNEIINKHQLDRNEIYEEIERRNNSIKNKYTEKLEKQYSKFNSDVLKRFG